MKATIHFPGDRSVGIFDYDINVDFGQWNLPFFDEDDRKREEYRQKLKEFFADLEGDNCTVYFDDECDCCRKTMKDGKCPNQYCMSNHLEEMAEEWEE